MIDEDTLLAGPADAAKEAELEAQSNQVDLPDRPDVSPGPPCVMVPLPPITGPGLHPPADPL